MNPLVLLTLIGGAHNDALMAGFLVVGLALAVQRHPVWALIFVAIATSIKAPAAIGLAFVAWNWHGRDATLRQRVRPFVIGGVVTGVVLGAATWMAGFGFGWINNLLTNGTVRSWAAPATGVGMALTNTFHALGCARDLPGVGARGDALPRSVHGGRLHALAALALGRTRLGALAGARALALRRARAGGPALVPGLGTGRARGELPGSRALLAAAVVHHRALHRPAGRASAPERAGALEPAADRGGRRDPRRRAGAPAGALDPVVLARASARTVP